MHCNSRHVFSGFNCQLYRERVAETSSLFSCLLEGFVLTACQTKMLCQVSKLRELSIWWKLHIIYTWNLTLTIVLEWECFHAKNRLENTSRFCVPLWRKNFIDTIWQTHFPSGNWKIFQSPLGACLKINLKESYFGPWVLPSQYSKKNCPLPGKNHLFVRWKTPLYFLFLFRVTFHVYNNRNTWNYYVYWSFLFVLSLLFLTFFLRERVEL